MKPLTVSMSSVVVHANFDKGRMWYKGFDAILSSSDSHNKDTTLLFLIQKNYIKVKSQK